MMLRKNKCLIVFMMLMTYFLNVLILSCASSVVHAEHDYNPSDARGWHWYEDVPTHHDDKEDDDDEDNQEDASAQLEAVRNKIKQALNKAILLPTKENVKNYIVLQRQMMNQSSKFANVWKAVLLENPELDYALLHPTNNLAHMIEFDQESKKQDAAIYALAKQSGLFFFYRSTCPYCRAFAPTLKQFASLYGIKVVPITTDGISLPEFPNSRLDQGQAQKFQVRVEPALFAVNPYTQKAYPIAYGLISLADLKKRILDIATHFDGDAR